MPESATRIGHRLAASRAADAMIRALGGTEAVLRVPIPELVTNADLGVASVLVEDVSLSPALLRPLPDDNGRHRFEVLISAVTIARHVDAFEMDSALQFFDRALGVLYLGKLLRIEHVAAEDFAGEPYLYRLRVTE